MKKIVGVVATSGVALLLLPAALLAADEGSPGLFSLNLGLSIWTIVVFLVLLWLLHRFAWGPILGAVESREKGIQGSIDEAQRLQAHAAALLEEHRKQLAEARQEAQQIVAQGREAGEQLRRQIEEKSRQEGEAMLERARREIQRERDDALDTLRKESVELALSATARLIGQKVDAAADRKLIEDFLDTVTELEREVRA